MTTGKTITLTRRTFVGKVMSLLFNMLSEKAMAPHSSTVARKIPWMEEPGRLQPMGSLRVRHDWAPSLSLFTFMHWRRTRQPTLVFLPGESQGRGAWWAACCLWGNTESDTTEVTQQRQQQQEMEDPLFFRALEEAKRTPPANKHIKVTWIFAFEVKCT